MRDNSWEGLARTLADMARDLLSQDSVQQTLDRIVVHAVELVDGCEAAGILTMDQDGVTTLADTGELVQESDRVQAELREGPCFEATRVRHQVLRIADMTTSVERWPRYAPRARELGVGSMMGFLLFTDTDDNLGALNMYSTRPDAFTDTSEQVGWLLASHAAVAFSSARTHAQLHFAMETRHAIGEALGIVMERYKLTEEQAFSVLTRSSQNENIKLREVARIVAGTGDLPGAR